ncbi:MAG: hydrogenase small subunit [Nitrospirota bacterium]
MKISRRDFLRYCGISAAALGLNGTDLMKLYEALATTSGPKVLWLVGSACTGCSVSFLNHISPKSPASAADLLINNVNLTYHPSLMATAGQEAAAIAEQAATDGGYILVVEGGVPTAFGGGACLAWTYNGADVTFQQAVTKLAAKASLIVCAGNCSAFGGIPAAYPNETGVKSVKDVTGKTTINIAGCPPHPDWLVWAISQILVKNTITVDSLGRPTYLFSKSVHDSCPRKGKSPARTYAQEGGCLKELGCQGPKTKANCSILKWNNGVSWCIDANAPCIGCTNPDFPAANLMKGGKV